MPKFRKKPQVRYIAWRHYSRAAYTCETIKEAKTAAIIHDAREFSPNRPLQIRTWAECHESGWQIARVVDPMKRERYRQNSK